MRSRAAGRPKAILTGLTAVKPDPVAASPELPKRRYCSGVVGAISGVGAFDFEFWHDDRAWSGGAPPSDELL
jgi:hypothetical protein